MNSALRLIRAAILSAVPSAFLIASPAAAQQAESFSLTGTRVAVFNLAGETRIEGGSGSAIQVEVVRGGSDAGRLDVATGILDLGRDMNDVETLRVLYPADDIVYSGRDRQSQTTLRVHEDGTFYAHSGRQRGRRVEIKNSGRGLDAHADLRIRVPNGRRVWVYLGAGEVMVSNVNGDLYVDVGSADVTSTDTEGYLNIDTGSGTVDVTRARGDVSLDTGSGEVRVTDMQGDELNVDTGSGGVRGSSISARSVIVDTGSGSVELAGLTATDIEVDTGSGSVELKLDASPKNVHVDTGSGSVTLRVPADYSADIEIDTSSGGIHTDFPIKLRRAERDHVVGTIGNGGGRLMVDTGSGSVRLERG